VLLATHPAERRFMLACRYASAGNTYRALDGTTNVALGAVCSTFAPFREPGSKPMETGRPGVALQRRRKRYRLEFTSSG
jgi:hypothetical protein